jgi:hypothetical protein
MSTLLTCYQLYSTRIFVSCFTFSGQIKISFFLAHNTLSLCRWEIEGDPGAGESLPGTADPGPGEIQPGLSALFNFLSVSCVTLPLFCIHLVRNSFSWYFVSIACAVKDV